MRKADLITLALLLVAPPAPAAGGAGVDSRAPGHSDGRTGSVPRPGGLPGKYVILEWVNFGCPFVGNTTGADRCRNCSGR